MPFCVPEAHEMQSEKGKINAKRERTMVLAAITAVLAGDFSGALTQLVVLGAF